MDFVLLCSVCGGEFAFDPDKEICVCEKCGDDKSRINRAAFYNCKSLEKAVICEGVDL